MRQKILFGGWLVLVGIAVATTGIVQSGRQAFDITLDYWYDWQFISSRALIIYTLVAPLVGVISYRIAWGKRKELEYELRKSDYALAKRF